MFKPRDIRIVIDGGKAQIFHPGAKISGHVTYKTLANERLQSVAIDFRGVEKVLAGKSSPFATPDHVEVFHINEVLQKTPLWTKGQTFKWNFDMTLPLLTGPDRSDSTKFYQTDADNSMFEVTPHPLAPSIGSEHSLGVRVEYQMYAVAMFGSKNYGTGGELAEASICDVINSLNYSPEFCDDSGSESSYNDIACVIGSGKTRSNLLGTLRRGSRTPASPSEGLCELVARIPSRISIGENADLSFQLNEDDSRNAVRCVLKQATIVLRASTFRRTKDCAFQSSYTEIKSCRLADITRSVKLSRDPASIMFPIAGLHSWPPTFQSYSISRSYQVIIEARLAVTIGELKSVESAKFVCNVELVRKVNQTRLIQRSEANLPPPSLEPHSVPIEQDVLPAYDMHEEHVLIGRGETIDQDDILESFALLQPQNQTNSVT